MSMKSAKAFLPSSLRNYIRENRRILVQRNFIDEYILAKHISYVIKERAIDLLIDVGANDGQFGRLVRKKAGYQGQIVSFEPQPEMYRSLSKSIEDDLLWQAHNFAIGKEENLLTLNVMQSSVFSSFLKPKEGLLSDLNTIVATTEVPVKRLDEVVKALNFSYKNVLLKTDTQGFDIEVLSGAEGILDRVEAIVSEMSFLQIYEGSPQYDQMIKLQNDLGYTLSGLYPVSLTRGQAIECDCIMVKKQGAAIHDHIPYVEVFTR